MTADELFGSLGHVTWQQECDWALVVFVYGLAIVWVADRRVFGKWAALDIIVSVIVGSNLSRVLTGQAALGGTLAAITALMVLHWVLAQATARSASLAALLKGTPIEPGRGGFVDQTTMRCHSVSDRDLDEALRQFSLALQLHFVVYMAALCDSLVGSSPERPGDDVSGLDALLRQASGDATDFLQ